jgi:SAM-dependent methyltransferase
MNEGFDKNYWESHWQNASGRRDAFAIDVNPYLTHETRDLARGTALEAGCGEGSEAIWLASEGWQVTAADISSEVLSRASERASADAAVAERIEWVEADLSAWEPRQQFDLVTTHYAHPAMPQLVFYERISHWVAPGGTLLVVGHLHRADTHGHDHDPPEKASVTAASISAVLDAALWDVVTAEEHSRTLGDSASDGLEIHDAVVRATRCS